jgi:hypothetical protein
MNMNALIVGTGLNYAEPYMRVVMKRLRLPQGVSHGGAQIRRHCSRRRARGRACQMAPVLGSHVAINTTSVEKTPIVGLLAVVSIALAIWTARRRGKGAAYC